MAISAAPTTWRPTFVGGSLGSGLSISLLRKLQIANYWLEGIFPGVSIRYVQGSPSGSKASGGTHLGPGDAVDVELVEDFGGRSPAIGVWIVFSLIMRLLNCVSYVRGSDVNGDGVKDDSFAQHCHVIDREGTGKVSAAVSQINLFVRHLNGLVGNHPDLEESVGNPIPLAQYTDELFRQRFLALTPAAASVAVHTEPKEESMSTLAAVVGSPAPVPIYLTDFVTARHITDQATLPDLVTLSNEGLINLTLAKPDAATTIQVMGVTVRLVRSMDVIGTVVGTYPATPTTVTATVDPAVLEAAVEKAVDAALANVEFTTRKA